ncbi:MAG TPA: hypothetical protein VIJ12_06580 [Candidatus Baltobacteraceae bacterium]
MSAVQADVPVAFEIVSAAAYEKIEHRRPLAPFVQIVEIDFESRASTADAHRDRNRQPQTAVI